MSTIFIRFNAPKSNQNSLEKSYIKKFIKNIVYSFLTKIIPKANPDFESKINDVKFWLLECDNEGIPLREIGIDSNERVLVKMPFKANYGYWTDNNLVLKDFIHLFNAIEISKDEFEKQWK